MITKFNDYKKLLENNEISGATNSTDNTLLSVKLDNRDYTFNIEIVDGPPTELKLYLDGELYADVSVVLPEFTKNLQADEFFINPEIDKRIIQEMVDQKIITKGNKEVLIGDKKSQSYFI